MWSFVSKEQGAGSREHHNCLTYSTSCVFSKNFIKRLLRLNGCVLATFVVFVKIFILKALGLNRCNLITSVVYAVDNGIKLLKENPLAIATNFLSAVFICHLWHIKTAQFLGHYIKLSIVNCQLSITADATVQLRYKLSIVNCQLSIPADTTFQLRITT
jgi:hypothetical protein